MKKRIIALILAVIMLCTLLPASALADNRQHVSMVQVNPLYRDSVSESDIIAATQHRAKLLYGESDYVRTMDEAVAIMRKGLEAHKEQININLISTGGLPMQEIAEKAMEETGVPTQGDYIRWSWAGWNANAEYYEQGGKNYYSMTFNCTYYTTAAQESTLTKRINSVLNGFGFTDKTTDYEKIKTIYDYICANVTYDFDHLNDESYKLKHTAYAALINGTAVCQGYALLMYRMLMQEGISCRLIPGSGHGWNIACLDGLYYNLDSTWDAGKSPKAYSCFLRSNANMPGHSRNYEYDTTEFNKAYPMSKLDYAERITHKHSYTVKTVAPTCTKKGYTSHTCSCGESYKDNYVAALGHDYSLGVCTRCGAKDPDFKLAAPTVKLANVASTGKIKVSWNKVEGATKYEVWRATSKSGTYTRLGTYSGTSLTNTTATAGKTYYYKVRAVAADGSKSAYSSVHYLTCACAQPVVKLTNVASSGKIKISWSKVEGATKYEVWRATSKSGTYSKLGTTTGTSYTNTSATAGKTYYYKVKAICGSTNTAGNSAFSSVHYLTCDLAAPTAKIGLSGGHPKVSWAKVDGATKYEVYRATSKSGTYSKLGTTTGTSYTNTSAKKGKTYYYKVKAVCDISAAASAYSSVKSIKAK